MMSYKRLEFILCIDEFLVSSIKSISLSKLYSIVPMNKVNYFFQIFKRCIIHVQKYDTLVFASRLNIVLLEVLQLQDRKKTAIKAAIGPLQ